MAVDNAPDKPTKQPSITTQAQAEALYKDSYQKLSTGDPRTAKVELDKCVDWATSPQSNKTFLANSLWLRAISEVAMQPTGSPDAEKDFKGATDTAKVLPDFDLVRYGELADQRGANLLKLDKAPEALAVYLDGLNQVVKKVDLAKPTSPAVNATVDLLADIGSVDNVLGDKESNQKQAALTAGDQLNAKKHEEQATADYQSAQQRFEQAAHLVRMQMRVTAPNSPEFAQEGARFKDILGPLKYSYSKQNMDADKAIDAYISRLRAEETQPGVSASPAKSPG